MAEAPSFRISTRSMAAMGMKFQVHRTAVGRVIGGTPAVQQHQRRPIAETTQVRAR
jgi:hypothetical protein